MAPHNRKKPRAKQQSYCAYCIEIKGWKPSYLFSMARGFQSRPGPYSEYATIEAHGVIVYPKKYEARSIEFYISGDRNISEIIMDPKMPYEKPHGVGHLVLRGKQSQFFCSVPFDVFPMVVTGFHDEDIRYVSISAEPLHYGQSTITSVCFDKVVDLDNY